MKYIQYPNIQYKLSAMNYQTTAKMRRTDFEFIKEKIGACKPIEKKTSPGYDPLDT